VCFISGNYHFGRAVYILWLLIQHYIVHLFNELHEFHGGHLYMWLAPLLAPESTVGKPRLVVVAVQTFKEPPHN